MASFTKKSPLAPEIKIAPLIEVQVINRAIFDQLPSVNNSEGLSPEYWERLRNEFKPVCYVEATSSVLGYYGGRLLRAHYLVYLDLAGIGLDAQAERRAQILALPQVFLK